MLIYVVGSKGSGMTLYFVLRENIKKEVELEQIFLKDLEKNDFNNNNR